MGAQGQEKIIFFWNASNWINGSKWSWWWYFLSIWTPQKESNTLNIIKRIFAFFNILESLNEKFWTLTLKSKERANSFYFILLFWCSLSGSKLLPFLPTWWGCMFIWIQMEDLVMEITLREKRRLTWQNKKIPLGSTAAAQGSHFWIKLKVNLIATTEKLTSSQVFTDAIFTICSCFQCKGILV